MTCLSANKQGADILLDYVGGTLDPAVKAELERHVETCGECRQLLAVSTRLEEWPVPEVSADFDARLYARIAREDAVQPWWKKYLRRPAIPVAAAACMVLALALAVKDPGTQDLPQQVRIENSSDIGHSGIEHSDIEQVEQALEDLELLMPLDASSPSQSTTGKM